MERLAQCLRLVCHNHSINISGIGATSNQSSSGGITNFSIARYSKGKIVLVEALILSKSVSNLPLYLVFLNNIKWKHLDGLKLTDFGFGTPGNVYLLLGADIFSCVVFYRQRFGPSGSPCAFKTQSGWVIAAIVRI